MGGWGGCSGPGMWDQDWRAAIALAGPSRGREWTAERRGGGGNKEQLGCWPGMKGWCLQEVGTEKQTCCQRSPLTGDTEPLTRAGCSPAGCSWGRAAPGHRAGGQGRSLFAALLGWDRLCELGLLSAQGVHGGLICPGFWLVHARVGVGTHRPGRDPVGLLWVVCPSVRVKQGTQLCLPGQPCP